MSDHTIRFAKLTDVDDIMNFIENHWKAGHILAQNKPFFLYEYQDDESINIAIARDNNTDELIGFCGFIKNTKALQGSDIWGSVWKVIKSNNPMLGIQILEFVNENTGCRSFSSCGIAPKTIPIYDFLRFRTGKLKHYYLLQDKVDYQIAIVNQKARQPFNTEKNFSLQEVESFETLDFLWIEQQQSKLPYKDKWYLDKRYCNHPIYHYRIFEVAGTDAHSVLIGREISHNGTKVFRIVDYIGDENNLRHIGASLEGLISDENYEYIDFYCEGIDEKVLQNAGFKYKDASDPNVIPNYFEPFVQQNIDIHFFTNSKAPIRIFKADGDQDRPNFSNAKNRAN